MQRKRFELEQPSIFRDLIYTVVGGIIGFIVIDYLFSGTAAFLGFIVFAGIVYILSRR